MPLNIEQRVYSKATYFVVTAEQLLALLHCTVELCKSHLTRKAKEPAEYMSVYASSRKPEVINWSLSILPGARVSIYSIFLLAHLDGLCKGGEWLSPFERQGKWSRHSCSVAESCLCKPKAEPGLWARSLSQTIALPMKHHCLLVGTSSPASSRFYKGALANSFQSFPSITVFLWAGKFPSRWHLTW